MLNSHFRVTVGNPRLTFCYLLLDDQVHDPDIEDALQLMYVSLLPNIPTVSQHWFDCWHLSPLPPIGCLLHLLSIPDIHCLLFLSFKILSC